MRVTVDVTGEETHEVDLSEVTGDSTTAAEGATADASDPPATYADLLTAIDYSPHEVSVLVDGRPVPEDQPVEADEITVLRLIKGG
ncbi:ubiquitin-like small modifier protein SAMP2 [Halovivax cerinus]|uniref:Ubiquitin-like small modifier protein 2 n=1 Tax=Halovivax cerinus TaxID=1487865 RepID=A0ABD5NRN0_9EURY|nr:ubiquitin-like small modifier protein 2 [Halovivax cerinus]